MSTITELLSSGNIGGAWQQAEELEGRTIPYTEFLATYIWND